MTVEEVRGEGGDLCEETGCSRIAERHFQLTESVLRDLVSTVERGGEA